MSNISITSTDEHIDTKHMFYLSTAYLRLSEEHWKQAPKFLRCSSYLAIFIVISFKFFTH